MAEIGIANSTNKNLLPGIDKLQYLFITPSTADSGDTLDVSTIFSTINFLICWDSSDGDIVTATESSNVITIDAAGGTTDNVYNIIVVGDAAKL